MAARAPTVVSSGTPCTDDDLLCVVAVRWRFARKYRFRL
jgi:hypothetical protein